LLLPTLTITHILNFVKPGLTRQLTAYYCERPQFVEVPGQVPTLPSPKSGFENHNILKVLLGFLAICRVWELLSLILVADKDVLVSVDACFVTPSWQRMYDPWTFQKRMLFIHKKIDFWFEYLTHKFQNNIIHFATTGKAHLSCRRCDAKPRNEGQKTTCVFASHWETPF